MLMPSVFGRDIFDDFMPMTKEENMKCDIYEKDGDYHIEMDVPGYDKKDIKVECNKGNIVVRAEHQEKHEDNNSIR